MILVPRKRGFKGVSEAVAMVLAFALVSFIILYAFVYVIPQLTTSAPSLNPGLIGEKLVLSLLRDISGGYTLVVKNNGQVRSVIDYLVLASASNVVQRLIVRVGSTSVCRYIGNTVSPGDILRINCTEDYIPIGVVSNIGKIYTIDPQLYLLNIGKTTIGLPAIPVYYGSLVRYTSDLLKYMEDPSMIDLNAIATSRALQRINTPGNPPIQVDSKASASIVFAGFSWSGNNYTLNLLVVGYNDQGAYLSLRDSTGQYMYLDLSSMDFFRYRIKIEGFRGTAVFWNQYGGWDLTKYPNMYVYGRLILSGVADRVVVYRNGTWASVVGLDPYLFVGDLDSNENTEIVFVTEDFTYGHSDIVNDWRGGPVVERSIRPMRLVFWNVPIDSRNYSMGVVTLRFFWWDNSLDPLSEAENRLIMRIGLYDRETASLVYSISFNYYGLIWHRNVESWSISWIVKDVLLLIPNTGKTYYIAVEIQDPFYMDGTKKDVDIIMGIEYIGIMLVSRG